MIEGLTTAEIATELGISAFAAKKRLVRAGIVPVAYAGRTAIYSLQVVEQIRNTRGRGRPPLNSED